MRQISLIFIVAFLFISCQGTKSSKEKLIVKEGIQKEKKQTAKEYTTTSGMKFVLHVDHSLGESICNLKIETQNFPYNETYSFENIDPITNIFITDLDENGYEELYVVTTSAGSGSYSNLLGIASNKDISTSPIYVPEINDSQREKGGLFEGFLGHNVFVPEERRIVNKFPVYKANNTNSNPTGGERKINYSLISGEAGWILKPIAIIP